MALQYGRHPAMPPNQIVRHHYRLQLRRFGPISSNFAERRNCRHLRLRLTRPRRERVAPVIRTGSLLLVGGHVPSQGLIHSISFRSSADWAGIRLGSITSGLMLKDLYLGPTQQSQNHTLGLSGGFGILDLAPDRPQASRAGHRRKGEGDGGSPQRHAGVRAEADDERGGGGTGHHPLIDRK